MTGAFQFSAFQNNAFQIVVVAQTFPVSILNSDLMAVLGFTSTQTLLYDYSNTEAFYVLVKPPEVNVNTLFAVSSAFASTWFASNSSNSLRIVFNPFLRVT